MPQYDEPAREELGIQGILSEGKDFKIHKVWLKTLNKGHGR